MSHVAEKHRNELRPAGKTLRTPFRLVFSDQMSKFCSGEIMKKLTKQAGTFYHLSALFGDCCMNFVGAKSYTTIHQEGISFKSYFGQE